MPGILITGAGGFIGGRAAIAFREAGWVTVSTGRRFSSSADYVQQDLATAFSSEFLRRLAGVDVVLHVAARSSPWGTRRQFERDNVDATRRLLEACEKSGRPRFLYVSSSSVFYQSQDQHGITELTPQASPAVNLYAETKQRAEDMVRTYGGLWVILRPRAVYGPGDTVLFPRILAAARAGRLPLLVRAGTPVTGDLIYIDNLIRCFVKAAENQSINGEFNLTDNAPVEIVAFLMSVFDKLRVPRPRRVLNVRHALRMALLIELFYRTFLWWKEPPITRFGVHVFAWSKTFNVQKMLDAFGAPETSAADGVQRFVDWIQQEQSQSP